MSRDELKLKNQICHRLYIASNGITRLYRPLLKSLGITYPQYVIMMALWEQDDITMGHLSKTTRVDKGFLATTIDRMESLGLLKVRTDAGDKRKKIIVLTAKGKKLEDQAKDIPRKIIQLMGASEADKKTAELLIKILDQINETLIKKST